MNSTLMLRKSAAVQRINLPAMPSSQFCLPEKVQFQRTDLKRQQTRRMEFGSTITKEQSDL